MNGQAQNSVYQGLAAKDHRTLNAAAEKGEEAALANIERGGG